MGISRHIFFSIASCCIVFMFSACHRNEYRLFMTQSNLENDSIRTLLKEESPVFKIRTNDILEISVYTGKGERIIDPDKEYMSSGPKNLAAGSDKEIHQQYLVQKDGSVFLPMVGRVVLVGNSIHEADSILSIQYDNYYKDSYVRLAIVNKRVLVFGPLGGKVIKLENENVNLVEALALYGGLTTEMRSDRIRIVRGSLSNPDVELVDLSTVSGMMKAQLKLLPGDIVYVEPYKNILRETMQDILPAVSLLVSLLTLLVIVNNR